MPKADRIYVTGAAYLLTTVTQHRFPYFVEDIFCNVLIDVIANCQKIKLFNLIGFKINPDHIHIVLQPTGEYNFSQIMHNIKRVSSIHINMILLLDTEYYIYEKYEWTTALKNYRRSFTRKYNYKPAHIFPPFDWQDDFDDQLIRTPTRLTQSIGYLKKQAAKHQLPSNNFLYITEKIPKDIVFPSERKKPPSP